MNWRLLLLVAALMLLAGTAHAEANLDQALDGVDVSQWQRVADEAGAELNVKQLLSGLARGEQFSADQAMQALIKLLRDEALGLIPDLMLLLGPALLWAINRQLLSGDGATLAGAAGYVCYLVEAVALIKLFGSQVVLARDSVLRIGQLLEYMTPALTSLLIAAGGATSAAMMSPMAAVAGSLLSMLVNRAAFMLCSCAAVFAVAGNLNERLNLQSLYKLAKSVNNWLLGVAMAGFLGVLTVNGLLGSVHDGISIRTARYAVRNMLPAVGREVSDTLDTMVASALLIKNAAGVTGLTLLVMLCARPLIRLTMAMMMCRLSAAVIEPVSGGPVVSLMDQFAGVMQMLLVALSTGIVLLMVIIGAVLMSGNAIAMLR